MTGLSASSEWVQLRQASSRGGLAEVSLVLTAVDIEHRLVFDGHHWGLWVPGDRRDAASGQLEAYFRENRFGLRRSQQILRTVDRGWFGVLGYLLVIWLLPSLEAQHVFGWDWRAAGGMDADKVVNGEWWRTITAMTLHADLAHIVANSLFGAVFGLFVGRYLGSGFGWLLVVLAGVLANGLNAMVQPGGFRSIGASTATFAALGLVGAFVWRRGLLRGGVQGGGAREASGSGGWRRNFAPVFAGIAMLAYTGMGGENTDILGHIFGFAAGFLLGIVAAVMDPARMGIRGQALAGACAAALIVSAWCFAGTA